MITGDLDAALAPEIERLAPHGAVTSSAGTWRPAPPAQRAPPGRQAPPGQRAPPGQKTLPGQHGETGTYATTVAFRLASRLGADPAGVADTLADGLRQRDWVEAASATGAGYLTVTVTAAALATLAVRITQAGPACARGTALAGTTVTAPRHACLAAAPAWRDAHRRLVAAITGRLAEAAGADVHWTEEQDSERMAPADPPPSAGHAPVADAIAFAGADAITFALARLPPAGREPVDVGLAAAHHLGNPAYAVRYAHAHAASTLRQAADLGLGLADAAGFQPRLLTHPSEQALQYELSWLPERVAGAARRGQPDVLARYLEGLAWAYLGCQQKCPAVWPGMRARAPATTAPATTARLWLAAAARTALGAGLCLLGVSAPERL